MYYSVSKAKTCKDPVENARFSQRRVSGEDDSALFVFFFFVFTSTREIPDGCRLAMPSVVTLTENSQSKYLYFLSMELLHTITTLFIYKKKKIISESLSFSEFTRAPLISAQDNLEPISCLSTVRGESSAHSLKPSPSPSYRVKVSLACRSSFAFSPRDDDVTETNLPGQSASGRLRD